MREQRTESEVVKYGILTISALALAVVFFLSIEANAGDQFDVETAQDTLQGGAPIKFQRP
jgi:hypothetical protein